MTAAVLERDVRAPATSRTGRYTETAEYAAFARRVLRALGARVAGLDIGELATLRDIAAEADRVYKTAGLALHDEGGYSWTEIGTATGTTAQTAWRKFTREETGHAA